MTVARPWILSFCLEKSVDEFLGFLEKSAEIRKFGPGDFEKFLELSFETPPHLVFVGDELGAVSASEAAQLLRSQFSSAPIYWISQGQPKQVKADLLKNGVTEVYSLLIDRSFLKEAIEDQLAKVIQLKAFKRVQILDLQPESTLPFDLSLHLPANQKFVKLISSGDNLSPERLEKLRTHQVRSMYVPTEQMDSFYEYTAESLRKMGSSAQMSATERQEKIQRAIRNLFSGLIGNSEKEGTFEEGKELVSDCQKIVDAYMKGSKDASWFDQIQQTLHESDSEQAHTGRVSSIAALFSLGLNIGKPEDLAIAGLLHDAGVALLPPELQRKHESDMNAKELELYKTHIDLTFELIQKRKLILSETIRKTIQQHHERFNGTGYPKGASGKSITKEAQVLALADDFDYRMNIRSGKRRISPKEALDTIRNEITSDPGKMRHDPELVKSLLKLFEPNPTK